MEQNKDVESPAKGSGTSALREIISWIACIAVAVVAAGLVHKFVGQTMVVNGPSMENTLQNGEWIVSSPIPFYSRQPKIGEVVVVYFSDEDRNHYIKRVVGLPGDKLKVQDGHLYRNGVMCDEPYIKEQVIRREMEEITVPEDTVFVMGDNRNDSRDSRSVGPIPLERVAGKAVTVLWPPNQIGGINANP